MSKILENLLKSFETKKNDPFLQYGIAIEYRNEGNLEKALEFFRGVHEHFPAYVPNYYHFGQALASLGELEEAARIYEEGIRVAGKSGDGHAVSELRGALEMQKLE
jgi:tetratricopeptide (TPR) repeat protein